MATIGPRASALIAVAAYFDKIENLTVIRGWPAFSPAERACIGNGKGLAAVLHIAEERSNCSPKLIGVVNDGAIEQVQTWRTGWLVIEGRLEVFTASRADRDRFEFLIEELGAPDIPTGSVGVILESDGYFDRPIDLELMEGELVDGADTSARSEYRVAFDLRISTDLVSVKRGRGTAKQLSTTATVTTTQHGTSIVESKTVTPPTP